MVTSVRQLFLLLGLAGRHDAEVVHSTDQMSDVALEGVGQLGGVVMVLRLELVDLTLPTDPEDEQTHDDRRPGQHDAHNQSEPE